MKKKKKRILLALLFNPLNASVASYRNKSIDFLCKSIDWFLYEGNTGIQWVNRILY